MRSTKKGIRVIERMLGVDKVAEGADANRASRFHVEARQVEADPTTIEILATTSPAWSVFHETVTGVEYAMARHLRGW